MIYIIDNGEEYSDHGIHFVESSLSLDDMREIVRCTEYSNDAKVIACADKVEWYEGGAMPVAQYSPPVTHSGPDAVRIVNRRLGNSDPVPMDAAVYRRLVEAVDAGDMWAATFQYPCKENPMPEKYPAMARAMAMEAIK
jgi:hypothetical protein